MKARTASVSLSPQPAEPDHEAMMGAITAAALMFAVLFFTAFAMWVTGSVWCLMALCVPAFIAPGLENLARRAGTVWIFFATAGLTLTGSLVLIAYGVWLTESLWPLWAIFAPFVGMGAGVAAWQGEAVQLRWERANAKGPVLWRTVLTPGPTTCYVLAVAAVLFGLFGRNIVWVLFPDLPGSLWFLALPASVILAIALIARAWWAETVVEAQPEDGEQTGKADKS